MPGRALFFFFDQDGSTQSTDQQTDMDFQRDARSHLTRPDLRLPSRVWVARGSDIKDYILIWAGTPMLKPPINAEKVEKVKMETNRPIDRQRGVKSRVVRDKKLAEREGGCNL